MMHFDKLKQISKPKNKSKMKLIKSSGTEKINLITITIETKI